LPSRLATELLLPGHPTAERTEPGADLNRCFSCGAGIVYTGMRLLGTLRPAYSGLAQGPQSSEQPHALLRVQPSQGLIW
jgi:hypothetical protein